MAIDLIVQHVHSQLEEVSNSWPHSHTPQPYQPAPTATAQGYLSKQPHIYWPGAAGLPEGVWALQGRVQPIPFSPSG